MIDQTMECPTCRSNDIHARGKRYALYPAAIPVVVGLGLAMIHQASTPFDYRCNACGREFARRSKIARVAWIIWLPLIWYFAIAFSLPIVIAFFRH